jgi:hypothetical protein
VIEQLNVTLLMVTHDSDAAARSRQLRPTTAGSLNGYLPTEAVSYRPTNAPVKAGKPFRSYRTF